MYQLNDVLKSIDLIQFSLINYHANLLHTNDDIRYELKNKKMDRTCDRCNCNIPHGNAYITLLYNIEQMGRDMTTLSDYVNVISSEELIVLCGMCGNQFNQMAIKQILKAIPLSHKKIVHN